MGRLDGKVCVITGAGSGIGRASATLFASEGAQVVVADVDDRGAKATVAAIRKGGGQAVAEHVDVTDEQETVALRPGSSSASSESTSSSTMRGSAEWGTCSRRSRRSSTG